MPTTYSSSNEVRSYQIDKDTIVLFDGSKSFFGSRSNLIILIVEHLDAKCIEMIVVDSLANSSAPRIYMNSNKLRNKFIKQKQIKLHELIDEYEKRFESYNITEITNKVETVLIVDYIISKLSFLSELPTGTVKDSFNPKFGQTVVDVVCEFYSKNLDVVCEKPSHLRPMEISDYKAGGIYDFHYALKQFKNDAKVRRTSSNDQALENNLKLSIDKFREALNNKLSADQPLYSGNVKTMPVKYFLSQGKLRWAKAIRKVLLRNQVAAIKRQLEDIQLEKELFRKTHKNGITRQRSVDDINVYENTNFNKQSKGKLDKQSNHDGSHLPTLDDDGKHHEKSGGESGRNGSFSLPGMQKGLVDENGRTFHGLFWSNPVNDSEDSLDGNPSDIDCSNHSGSEKHFEKPNSSKIFDNPKSHANHINGLKKGKHGCKYNHIHHDIDDTMNKNEGSLSNMIVYNKSKEALEAIAKGKLYHDIDRAHINMGITNGNATVHHLRHQLDTPAMIAMKVMNSVETKQAEKSDENKKNKRRHTYDEHLPNLLENNKNVPRYAQATSSSLLSDHHKIDTVKNTTKGVKSGNSSNSSSRSSSRTRTRPSLEKRGDSNHLEPINLLGSTGQKDVRESRAASEVKGKPPIGRKRTESISGSELDMSEAFFDVHDHRAQFQTDARLETRQLRLVSKAFLM